MDSRRIGQSDLEVRPVALGAWAIGGLMWGGVDEADAEEAIRVSLDAGVDLVDTAPAYGCGRSEEIVGRAIQGRRDEVVLATKCGLRWERDDGALRFDVARPEGGRVRVYHNLKPDSLREECEASLRRLQVEVIDLYQVHWPYAGHPLDDAMDALVRLREQGKVRHLGVSNFELPDLESAWGRAGIVSCQPPYSLVDRRAEATILPWCQKQALGVLAYSPMGRGLLTGKVGVDRVFAESDHRGSNPAFAEEPRQRVLAALDEARALADQHDVSLGNLAVAWVLARPGVTVALVGARNAEQARENARTLELELSQDEVKRLAEVFPQLPWAPSIPKG